MHLSKKNCTTKYLFIKAYPASLFQYYFAIPITYGMMERNLKMTAQTNCH